MDEIELTKKLTIVLMEEFTSLSYLEAFELALKIRNNQILRDIIYAMQ